MAMKRRNFLAGLLLSLVAAPLSRAARLVVYVGPVRVKCGITHRELFIYRKGWALNERASYRWTPAVDEGDTVIKWDVSR